MMVFTIAPLFSHLPNHAKPLTVPYSNVMLQGKITSGFVDFGNLSFANYLQFTEIIGVMPEEYVIRFRKTLNKLFNAIHDIE